MAKPDKHATDMVTGTIDLATALGDSASGVTIPASNIVSFSFSDGVQTITNSTSTFSTLFSQFYTSATGVPIAWDVELDLSSGAAIDTCGGTDISSCDPFISKDDLGIGQGAGEVSGDPGTWTVTTTPLPAALPLFAGGLGALGLFGWRRERKADALAA